MNTSQWTKVAELAELKENQPKAVQVEKNVAMLIKNGAVPINAQFKTESDAIYAAGDIALAPHPFAHKSCRIDIGWWPNGTDDTLHNV
ncbi:hypothetical protein JXA70_05275 [candidate division KSB1 bacterium]|nr:hypothetical protein [candidate division KSB1 bacterium]